MGVQASSARGETGEGRARMVEGRRKARRVVGMCIVGGGSFELE